MSYFKPERYVELVDDLRLKYKSFPSTISIETLSLCNAYCSFCPYVKLKRKGSKLSDANIDKIIEELEKFPDEMKFTVVLSRVNEPFLDKRWYDIVNKILLKKKNINFGFFSNGSTLDEDVIFKLNSLSNILYLNLSLNYANKLDYESNTRLDFDTILRKIDVLHEKKKNNKFQHQVLISRVGTGDLKDLQFSEFVTKRFPLFKLKIANQVNWLCDMIKLDKNIIGHIPCRQWFQVHILADGNDGFCCIDSDGEFGSGSIFNKSILELYNHETKKLAREAKCRSEVDICRNCTFMP